MDAGEKLLQRMRDSQAGWTVDDVESLYTSFGFEMKDGGSHRKYFHPAHPELFAVVPRHRKVKSVYIRQAVKTVNRLKKMEPKDEE